jgi:hypothetical protein
MVVDKAPGRGGQTPQRPLKAASQFLQSTPTLLMVCLTWVDDQIINSNASLRTSLFDHCCETKNSMSNPLFVVACALSDCNAKGSDGGTVPLPFPRILATKYFPETPLFPPFLRRHEWLG